MKQKLLDNWKLFLIASITLGLAPFNPPHIWSKIQWIAGGNAFSGENAMQFQDYFDVVIHGSPWILFLFLEFYILSRKNKLTFFSINNYFNHN